MPAGPISGYKYSMRQTPYTYNPQWRDHMGFKISYPSPKTQYTAMPRLDKLAFTPDPIINHFGQKKSPTNRA